MKPLMLSLIAAFAFSTTANAFDPTTIIMKTKNTVKEIEERNQQKENSMQELHGERLIIDVHSSGNGSTDAYK